MQKGGSDIFGKNPKVGKVEIKRMRVLAVFMNTLKCRGGNKSGNVFVKIDILLEIKINFLFLFLFDLQHIFK